jgi:polyphosphate kinase
MVISFVLPRRVRQFSLWYCRPDLEVVIQTVSSAAKATATITIKMTICKRADNSFFMMAPFAAAEILG